MIRNILTTLAASLCICVFSLSAAQADILHRAESGATSSEYSGQYMFTYWTEDKSMSNISEDVTGKYQEILTELQSWLSAELGLEDFTIDTLFQQDRVDGTGTSGTLTVASSDKDNRAGTWTSTVPIQIYAVKGANDTAFYWLGLQGQSEGLWSTEHLINNGGNNPGLSHFNSYEDLFAFVPPTTLPGQLPTPVPTPEPSTLVLMALGVLGLGILRRRIA